MYKYDIPYPKDDQYALLFNGLTINVSKNKSYLKGKMKAHRDEVGANDIGAYSIKAPNGSIVFKHTYQVGELGESKSPYQVIAPKPDIVYKSVFLYADEKCITDQVKEDARIITSYEAICNPDGTIATDLNLLKKLSDVVFYERLPIPSYKKLIVAMATYLPETKDELIKLQGMGEKLYDKCGERLLSVVKEYLIGITHSLSD